MKKIIFITLILITTCVLPSFTVNTEVITNSNNEFCKGWEEGYINGWCADEDLACITPLVPLCPIAPYGADNYMSGYNRGYNKGYSDRQRKGY